MSERLATLLLDQLRASFKVSIGVVQVTRPGTGEAWRLEAVRNDGGERWQAEHEDYYAAAVMLADLMGFELRDG